MQSISIFVSSTFKDMMLERDILRRYVLPELSNYYNHRGIDIQLIDLRWGVVAGDGDSEEREKKILKCCKDTIEICKPFFIGFIGHRYGWIPSETIEEENGIPLSVTHVEIKHGVLDSNNFSRSLLFKRDIDSYKNVKSEEYDVFVDFEKDIRKHADAHFSQILKGYENANSLNNIISYYLDVCQPSNEEVFGFAQLIISNLKRIINKEIHYNPKFSYEYSCELFLKNYIIPTKLYDNVLSNIFAGNHTLIYGEIGSGKTSFAIHLFTQLKCCMVNVFLYSTDVMLDNKKSFKDTILQWSEYLSSNSLHTLNAISDEWSRFKYLHKKQSKRSVIIVDGYDKIKEIRDSNLFLIPTPRIVFVVLSSASLQKWELCFEITPYILNGFSWHDAKAFINQVICTSNKKSLPNFVYDIILNERKFSDNKYSPLDLSLLVSYILSIDKEDFEQINKITGVSQEKALYNYIASIIKEMPKDNLLRFNYIFQKVFDIFGKEKMASFIYIALSLFGLSEQQLSQLKCDYDPFSFYLIRNYLKPYFPANINNGRWRMLNNESNVFIKSIIGIDISFAYYFYSMSKLKSITEEEKFYYGLYGYNKELVYALYSSVDNLQDDVNMVYNGYLQKYFEEEKNYIWFLSILKYRNPYKNEKILSNLLFSFYSYYVRQNSKIDAIKFLKCILYYMEYNKVVLNEKDTIYYTGVLSECMGREILNRNINMTNKQTALIYIKKAISCYEQLGNETKLNKKHLENYLKRLS